MKIHRFIVPFVVRGERAEIDDKALLHQFVRVLRFKKGEEIILGNGSGTEVRARIDSLSEKHSELSVLEQWENANEPERNVILYASVLKRENFEWTAQKATEAGIKEIIPVLSVRTVKTNLNETRIRAIMKEAAEQSGRGIIPTLHSPMPLAGAFEHARKNGINFFFDASGGPLPQKLPEDATRPIGLFTGPEGGWDKNELDTARANGCHIITLGRLTLRAETAAIIAAYIFAHKE